MVCVCGWVFQSMNSTEPSVTYGLNFQYFKKNGNLHPWTDEVVFLGFGCLSLRKPLVLVKSSWKKSMCALVILQKTWISFDLQYLIDWCCDCSVLPPYCLCVLTLWTTDVFCDSVPGTHDDSCQCFLTVTALPSVGNCQHCQHPTKKGQSSFGHVPSTVSPGQLSMSVSDVLQWQTACQHDTSSGVHYGPSVNTIILIIITFYKYLKLPGVQCELCLELVREIWILLW